MYNFLTGFNENFGSLNDELKLNSILCPVDPIRAKLANKYLALLVKSRSLVDEGKSVHEAGMLSIGEEGISVIL